MFLCKVTGTTVATQKNKNLVGHKLLIVHPVDLEYNLTGYKDMIALDFADAGVGDIVLVVQEGDAIEQLVSRNDVPAHTAVIAVIDNIYIPQHE